MVHLIEADRLCKDYGNVKALSDVSLKVNRGEIFGFFGPNGAGKTTCIKVLCGLTKPTGGDATVLDIDVRKHPVWVRENVAVLSEETRFYEEMTPRRYLDVFAKLMLMKRAERLGAINDAADLADLRGYLDRRISLLSQGERQRVALARVLLADCPLLFLDEPFEGVDIIHRRAVREHFRDYVSKGNTIFFTSHNLLEAEHIVDRFAFINRGRLIAVGTADELKDRYLAPSFILRVSDPEKARDALNGQLPLQFLKIIEGQVAVTLQHRSDSRLVAKTLVESGVDIFEMRATGTMEEVFERIAGGDAS